MTMDAVFPKCFFKGLRTIPLIQINATQAVVYVRSMWRAMMLACGVAVSGVEHFASLPLFWKFRPNKQDATVQLSGNVSDIGKFNIWYSCRRYDTLERDNLVFTCSKFSSVPIK